ncbi:MAG: hypothetical protein V8R46_08430 [Eubacterium ramulus]
MENAALAILAMRILQQQYPEEVAGENAEGTASCRHERGVPAG